MQDLQHFTQTPAVAGISSHSGHNLWLSQSVVPVYGRCCCREKAPFVLIVETLAADVQPASDVPSTSSQGSPEIGEEDGEGSARTTARRQASSQYADSVQSLLAGRSSSNASAGPGPGSPQGGGHQPGRSVHRRNDTAGSALPSPGSPTAEHASQQEGSQLGLSDVPPARSELTTRRSLSFSEALPEPSSEGSDQARQQAALARSSGDMQQAGRPSHRQLGRSSIGKSGHHDDAVARYGH